MPLSHNSKEGKSVHILAQQRKYSTGTVKLSVWNQILLLLLHRVRLKTAARAAIGMCGTGYDDVGWSEHHVTWEMLQGS